MLTQDGIRNLFGFAPKEFDLRRGQFDFALIDKVFPHPTYGTNGWISVINPGDESADVIEPRLDFSLGRALKRVSPGEG